MVSIDDKRVIYRQVGNEFKFFCTECGETFKGNKRYKQIITKTKLCPNCHNIIRTSKETDDVYCKCFMEDDNGYCYHYKVNADGEEIISKEHIYYKDGEKQYRKNYHIYYQMYAWTYNISPDWESDNEWHRTYSQNWDRAFYTNVRRHTWTHKEFLEACCPELKSNQKYMVIHNHINKPMLNAIKIFDLNNIDACYKHSAYINKYITDDKCNHKLNEYTLNYLHKNKIPFNDYCDYLKTCEECGIKNKYPKDFREADAELNKIKSVKEVEESQKKYGRKILKRFKELAKVEKNGYIIQPYKNCFELSDDAFNFHNCIYRSYTGEYADGKTDLYRCLKDGKLVACIEIKDNMIIQIRSEYNKTPDEEKIIKRILNKNILKDNCDKHIQLLGS